jgi:capsid protein
MGLKESFKSFFSPTSEIVGDITVETKFDPTAYSSYRPLFNISYDGEKNSGELGAPLKYNLDYRSLRLRSWQSYLDNEITQTAIKKFVLWVIGGGLKLQSEPVESVLGSEGATIDSDKFSKAVEDRFKLFSEQKSTDFSGLMNLNEIASRTYLNAIVGGDVLVVQRVVDGNLKIELIDGAHIKNPIFGTKVDKGNELKNGIETNKRGEHVKFWIQQADGTFKTIKAKGSKMGREMAFMVFGLKYRLDDNRGIPLIATTLETLQKLDRYKEATVGSAEERAKIPYFIEHGTASTGENPMTANMAKAFNVDAQQDIATDINGQQLADNIAVSMNKQVYNLPVDSKIVSTDTKSDIHFNEFYTPMVQGICSAMGIPPDVALSLYNGSFSSSRAALKDWEHTLNVERKKFSDQFYKKIYSFWLELEVLKNKIQAPGYISLLTSRNEIGIAAYQHARFIGANVPHIDPVKEVAAERLKLGRSGADIPLTTAEAATEALNGGDYESNVIQYEKELENSKKAGITPEIQQEQTNELNSEENDE